VELAFDLITPPRFEDPIDPRIPLLIPEEDQQYIASQLRRFNVEDKPVLLNPGAGWVTKRWPSKRYGQLGRRLREDLGAPVLFTFGPGEEYLIQEASDSGPTISFPTTILQLAALLRRSRVLVAGDTGPLHLAVAMGLPTVAILGPALPWRTGPYGAKHRIVMHSRSCPHPYQRTCSDHFCMDIPVEEVFAAVSRSLSERQETVALPVGSVKEPTP
jgi:ADP-heptose:LPS heptosyltransferase